VTLLFTMTKLSLALLLLSVPTSAAFIAPGFLKTKGCSSHVTRMADSEDFSSPSRSFEISRQDVLRNLMGIAGALAIAPSVARADVADGNQLPEGAARFNRVLRVKTDLQVRIPRLTPHASGRQVTLTQYICAFTSCIIIVSLISL
jgi:hypothetical protein